MTLEDHNKTLGIMHVVYGGLHALLLVFMFMLFGVAMLPLWAAPSHDAQPVAFFLALIAVVTFISLFFLVPPLVAGYGLLKRKKWGRTAGIVAAILMALNVPLGTALAVYTLWFLFGKGARLYEDDFSRFERYSLADAPPPPTSEWFDKEREREFAPPAQPPDWR
jgi:hypothetical protein